MLHVRFFKTEEKPQFCLQSTNSMETDVFGKALLDYLNDDYSEDILTYSSLDEDDVIPVPYLFRTYEDMPGIEQKALDLCNGHVLDIGCGSGSHSLYLQKKGIRVTALDHSAGAMECCQLRGIENTLCTPILEHKGMKYDTLLLLMNGIGIVGKLEQLKTYLEHFKSLMNPKAQILLDSSDIIYMFDDENKDEDPDDLQDWELDSGDYYGEVDFTMQYKGMQSKPFPWLYIDFTTLKNVAHECHLECELVTEGEHFDYLARLTHL